MGKSSDIKMETSIRTIDLVKKHFVGHNTLLTYNARPSPILLQGKLLAINDENILIENPKALKYSELGEGMSDSYKSGDLEKLLKSKKWKNVSKKAIWWTGDMLGEYPMYRLD